MGTVEYVHCNRQQCNGGCCPGWLDLPARGNSVLAGNLERPDPAILQKRRIDRVPHKSRWHLRGARCVVHGRAYSSLRLFEAAMPYDRGEPCIMKRGNQVEIEILFAE